MGNSEFDPAILERRPWNAGRMVGAKRALKPQQVWAIRFWLDRERRLRDRAVFDPAINSKLHGYDVVNVKSLPLRPRFEVRPCGGAQATQHPKRDGNQRVRVAAGKRVMVQPARRPGLAGEPILGRVEAARRGRLSSAARGGGRRRQPPQAP